MPYTVTERGVTANRVLTGLEVQLTATSIRKAPTGVHARIAIFAGPSCLAYDLFNIERDRERTHLARRAHGLLGDVDKKEYPVSMLQADLDTFCARVWQKWLERFDVEAVGGSGEIGPPEFYIPSTIIKDGGTILFGPPGRGKSYLALLMAVSIDAGCDSVWPVQQVRTLFINLERSRLSLRRRVGLVNVTLGLDLERPLLMMNARGRSLADVFDAAQENIRKNEVGLVFMDSLSRAGLGSMTKDEEANSAMDLLNALAPTWAALGHTPRQDETHVFGSQMFDAAIDCGIQITSQRLPSGTLGLALSVVKANDFAPPAPHQLALEFDVYGLAAVRPPGVHEFPKLDAGQGQDLGDDIYEYLVQFGAGSATDLATALDRNRSAVSSLLNVDPRFTKVGKRGRSMLYGVKAEQ